LFKKIMVLLVAGILTLALASTACAAPKFQSQGNSRTGNTELAGKILPPGLAKKVTTEAELTLQQGKGKGVMATLRSKVRVRKQELKFDVPPVIKEGRTLVPVRAITQGLGATVDWDAENKTVTVIRGEDTVVLTLGSNVVTVNGEPVTLDVPAQLVSNRTFVPLRFLGEIFKQKVSYDEETGDIDIDDED